MGTHYPMSMEGYQSCGRSLRKKTEFDFRNTRNAKPVSVIEDTAVAPQRLPAYIADMKRCLTVMA